MEFEAWRAFPPKCYNSLIRKKKPLLAKTPFQFSGKVQEKEIKKPKQCKTGQKMETRKLYVMQKYRERAAPGRGISYVAL